MTMRFAWVGFHAEGIPALVAMLGAGAPISGVITLREELASRRGHDADYRMVCEAAGVPLYGISNINEPGALTVLRKLDPDVVFIIGWHQIVHAAALRQARIGMIGAHASLLPHNRGSAPINWAIIRGEHETGNTLFWLREDVGSGDIIDQTSFRITPYDSCASLYGKVAASNREMLLRLLPKLMAGERPGSRQPQTVEPVLPRRWASDGWIDWTQPGFRVYDFIRALTRPYPGAFSELDGQRWRVWNAALPPHPTISAAPGTLLGAVYSPLSAACGQMVACGEGAIVLLELEDEKGVLLTGPELSDRNWNGKKWLRKRPRISITSSSL